MLEKIRKESGTPCCGRKTFKFLARMTKGANKSSACPYKKMESDCKEKKKCKKSGHGDEVCKGKENCSTSAKEIREKKSKKKVRGFFIIIILVIIKTGG